MFVFLIIFLFYGFYFHDMRFFIVFFMNIS